jgi:ATP-dependent DNA helicase RecG
MGQEWESAAYHLLVPGPTLSDLVASLRAQGGDTTEIEVKSAAGGMPQTIGASLCALANLPGGGWVILGLDEGAGFIPVGLTNATALKQGLGVRARDCVPPVVLEISQQKYEGSPVVLARVAECDRSAKPCKIGGRGWVRSWDGDFQMSDLEEQAFLRLREAPLHDVRPVAGATRRDLDDELLGLWRDTVRLLDSGGLGRFDDDAMLVHGGVLTADGVPTVAGLLTLGVHPQQFIPRYVVNLSAHDRVGGVVRAREAVTLSGPIPRLLEGAVDWAAKVFERTLVTGDDGQLRDRWQYPLEAVREVIGNALVHRDLDSWSQNMAVEVRLHPDKLVVTNPGGLYGITVDRLGRPGTSSPRNGKLVEVCRFARTSDDARVVETLASGIPKVMEALTVAGLPPARFSDTGIQFTAILRSSAARNVAPAMSPSQRAVFMTLAAGPLRALDVAKASGLKPDTARKALHALVQSGVVEQRGGRGKTTTTYTRSSAGAAQMGKE